MMIFAELFFGFLVPSQTVTQVEQEPNESEPPKTSRIVNFPKDRSIGGIYLLDLKTGEWEDNDGIKGQGKFVVPAGKGLGLVFGDPPKKKNGPADLSVLDQLGANDLQMIGIPFQRITAESLRPLKRHRSLKHLGLGPLSKVADETLAPLAEMTWLEGFAVSETEVTDAGLKHLSKLVNLKALHLPGTKITDAGLIYLKVMTKLKLLDLSGTKITNEGLKHLAGLKEMEQLNVGVVENKGPDLVHLKKMAKLKSLHLTIDDTAADLAQLKTYSELESLSLRGEKIDDAALNYLTHLRDLKTMTLYNTKVTDEGAKRFQQALPDCEILRQEKAGRPDAFEP